MDIKLKGTDLNAALSICLRFINQDPIVPILEGILFEVTPEGVKLTASDLLNTVEHTIGFWETSRPSFSDYGKQFIIHARTLFNAVSGVTDTVTIEFGPTEDLNHDRIKISHGTFILNVPDDNNVKDWPRTPQPISNPAAEFHGTSELFASVFSSIYPFTTNDDLRPAMTGILMESDGNECLFVGTNGHLLKTVAFAYSGPVITNQIIPRKTANAFAKMKLPGSMVLAFEGTRGQITAGNTRIYFRLIDERYPDFRNAIPLSKNAVYRLKVNRKRMIAAVKRVTRFTKSGIHQIRMTLKGTNICFDAENTDSDVIGKQSIDAEKTENPEFFAIGFNGKFLEEALLSIRTEFVTVELTAENRAAIINPELDESWSYKTVMLVMPVMITTYANV